MFIFPQDTDTHSLFLSGASTTIVHEYDPNEYSEVISVSMQQEKDLSNTELYCGDVLIAKNYAKDLGQIFMSYPCYDDITIEKTGNDEAFVSVVILHSTTTMPKYINNFSYGDIMIGFILFLMLTGMFFSSIYRVAIGVKQKNKMSNEIIGNNSKDGKVIYYD